MKIFILALLTTARIALAQIPNAAHSSINFSDLPAWTAGIGLQKTEAGWAYIRKDPADGSALLHPLDSREQGAVADFLSDLPANDPESALAQKLANFLRIKNISVEQSLWYEPSKSGLGLSEWGKRNVLAIFLGLPYTDRPAANPAGAPHRLGKFPALQQLDSDRTLAVSVPNAFFDGAAKDPSHSLYLGWNNLMDSTDRLRTINSIYGLYGQGADALIHKTLRSRPIGRRSVRMAKAFADALLAMDFSLMHHEFGHWDGAEGHAYWRPSPGLNVAFEHAMWPLPTWWNNATHEQHLSFTTGGLWATQSAAEETRRFILREKSPEWELLPLLVMNKFDITSYTVTTPRPGHATSQDKANDILRFRLDYSRFTGQTEASVWRQEVRGAVWNALDPTMIWAIFGYLRDYVWKGEEHLRNPMFKIGGLQAMVGTGFSLTPVGPQYRLPLYLRKSDNGQLTQIMPALGDHGQWTLELSQNNIQITKRLNGRVILGFGRERVHTQLEPNRPTAAAGFQGDFKVGRHLAISGKAGYKTTGTIPLGTQFRKGAFAGGGVNISF